MTAYTALKHFHLLTVAISIALFVLRFFGNGAARRSWAAAGSR